MALLMQTRNGTDQPGRQLTLDEYLALPEDTRAEVVDGVLRPMVRSNKKSRRVQRRLAGLLEQQLPRGLQVEIEEVVVLQADPATSRIPDVVVFRRDADPTGESNSTHARDVLLVVEVVSPASQTADRYEKPGAYARAGIPAFWRIELEPAISVHVYRLIDEVYRDEGVYTRGGLVKDPTLPWLSIEVNDLLGDHA
ncbi:MAG TPA: Uma2 family endonuclease [Natronosporangium sp.]